MILLGIFPDLRKYMSDMLPNFAPAPQIIVERNSSGHYCWHSNPDSTRRLAMSIQEELQNLNVLVVMPDASTGIVVLE